MKKLFLSPKLKITTIMLWFVCAGMFAQNITVKGVITDSSNEPLPGASVVVKGNAQKGNVSDADGNYTLTDVPANATLVFNYIGMESKEEAVNRRTTINVVLKESSLMLDEVVVTAMGIQRDRKSLGYAISTIKAGDLNVAGVSQNPIQSLYGKAAGVHIRQSTSGPLGGININIRGAAGLQSDANTRPLFVVDGVPIHDKNTEITGDGGLDYGTGINDINSEDIESIDILKGAKASVLYGSEGANGVVLITTKSGKGAIDKTNVNVSFQYSSERPRNYLQFQNTYGSGGNIYSVNDIAEGASAPTANTGARNFGPAFDASQSRIWWDGVSRPYVAHPDNYDFLFDNGHNMVTNVAVEKAGTFGNFRLSYTNMDYKGIEQNLGQGRNVVSLSNTMKLSNRFSIETIANLYSIKTKNRTGSFLTFFVNGMDRGAAFEDFIGNEDYLVKDPLDPNYGYRENMDDLKVPTGYYSARNFADYAWDRRSNSGTDDKLHIIASVRPTYRLTDYLSVTAQANLDYTDTDYTTKSSVTRVYPNLVGGQYRYKKENNKIQEYKAMINFTKDVTDRLDASAFIGASYKKNAEDWVEIGTASTRGASSGFNYPNWYHINNQNPDGWPYTSEYDKIRNGNYGVNSLYGLFGVATFTWDGIYTLELNARNDWSSTLPPENNSYFYPGVAFTWNATNVFRSLSPIFEFANFRASWADVGRDSPSRYYAYNSLEAKLIEGTSIQGIEAPGSLFSGALKPERKREFELGTQMSFFKGGRLRLDASFYTNSVYDQIMAVPLSKSTGATEIKINAGQVNNWGYELEISGTPVVSKDFRWDVTFTTSNQYTKVEKLYPGITKKNISGMRGQVNVMAVEGERVGNIYGVAMLRDPNGNRIVSSDGASYVLDNTTQEIMGNVHPNFLGGLNTTFGYKGFRVYAHFDYSFGSTMYSETNQWMYYNGTSKNSLNNRDEAHGGLAYYIDNNEKRIATSHNATAPADSKDGRIYHDGIILPGVKQMPDGSYQPNDVIAPVSGYYGTFVSWAGEAINALDLKFKNDYIKLREVAVSYRIPSSVTKKMKMENLTLSLYGRNLAYLYKTIPNLDSEAYMGTSRYHEASTMPSTQSFGFKIDLGF